MNPKYLVIELQTNTDGTVGHIATAHDALNEAESKFHQVLAAAAVSSLPIHAAVLLRSDGALLERRDYRHGEAV